MDSRVRGNDEVLIAVTPPLFHPRRWIPAFAGMTSPDSGDAATLLSSTVDSRIRGNDES